MSFVMFLINFILVGFVGKERNRRDNIWKFITYSGSRMPEPDLGSKKLSGSFFDRDGALKEPETVCVKGSSNRCTLTERRQKLIWNIVKLKFSISISPFITLLPLFVPGRLFKQGTRRGRFGILLLARGVTFRRFYFMACCQPNVTAKIIINRYPLPCPWTLPPPPSFPNHNRAHITSR